MPWRAVLSILALIWAAAPATAQGTADPLASGTLPIVPCSAGANLGCVEFMFDGPLPLVPCWQLPPFADAGVSIEMAAPTPAPATRTRRVILHFAPLDAVPAGQAVPLAFGVAAPGQPLVCNQVVSVERRPSVLSLGNAVDLGDIQVEVFGLVRGAPVILPVFPAAGQPPIGPLSPTPGELLLYSQTRIGAPLPITVQTDGARAILANRLGELRLAPAGNTRWFSALGTLTAPQLVAPHQISVQATARIGWVTILLVLAVGIGAGWYVRRNLIGRQQITATRLRAERAVFAASRARGREKDAPLIADLTRLAADLRRDVAEASDSKTIDEAISRFDAAWKERLDRATADRAALAAAISPVRTALTILPPASELPREPLASWRAALDEAQAMLDAGELDRPRQFLTQRAEPAASAAGQALADYARRARAGLAALGEWQQQGAADALRPLADLAPQFALAPDTDPLAALVQLDDADRALRAAAQDQVQAIAAVVQPLAARIDPAKMPDAQAEATAILTMLSTRPVQALSDLVAFATRAKAAGFRAGEALGPAVEAFVPAPPQPAVPNLALVTDPPIPLAGRDVRVTLSGLPDGVSAHIRTPTDAERLDADQPGPSALLRMGQPGALAVEVLLRDADGQPLPAQMLSLHVSPDPDRLRLDARATASRRVETEATVVAAALAALTGAALFSELPLTNWWALFAPFLWGFFVNLNLAEAIETLRGRRDALVKVPADPPAPG